MFFYYKQLGIGLGICALLVTGPLGWAQEATTPAAATPEATVTPDEAAAVPVKPPTLGLSGRQIMEKVKDHRDNPDETSKVEMVLISKSGSERKRQMLIKRKTDPQSELDKIMIRFSAPADIRGTSLLTWEKAAGSDQQWVYLPALKKTKKIAGSGKKDDFVGSDFTYEDMRPLDLDANQYSIVQETADVVVIDVVPQDADSAYSRRRMTIQKSNFVVLGVDYYDKKNQLLKRMRGADFVQVEPGRWRSNTVEVKNIQNGHATILRVQARRLNTGLGDSDFTQRALELGG